MNPLLQRAAYVIRDEKVAKLLVDPMRRTILNLLADNAYTQSQMADIVGLTDASVGHHLGILAEANLIRIVRREEGAHGIMQNFYRSVALCIVVDTEHMSKSVSKYFFPIHIERIRGAMAALSLGKNNRSNSLKVGSHDLESIAEKLAVSIAREARKIAAKRVSSDRETVTITVYRRALKETMRQEGVNEKYMSEAATPD